MPNWNTCTLTRTALCKKHIGDVRRRKRKNKTKQNKQIKKLLENMCGKASKSVSNNKQNRLIKIINI